MMKHHSLWRLKAVPRRRIAYIHIPKCGGESLFVASDRANVASCNGGTGLGDLHFRTRPCSCQNSTCLSRSHIAIQEHTFASFRAMFSKLKSDEWQKPVYFSIVREPA